MKGPAPPEISVEIEVDWSTPTGVTETERADAKGIGFAVTVTVADWNVAVGLVATISNANAPGDWGLKVYFIVLPDATHVSVFATTPLLA